MMWYYLRAWSQLPTWEIPENFVPRIGVSILIPARNEAENILDCLQSILKQNYPKELFEIIVIDDHSEDETVQVVQNIDAENLRLLQLEEYDISSTTTAFKKIGIEKGVEVADHELIVTTDADCVVGRNWLALLSSYYQYHNVRFIAAPVNFHQEQNAFERFQSLDFIGMMGVTGAGIYKENMHMCNGANLAYERRTFQEIGGFKGIDHLPSGDDMLLLQKIAHSFPGEIGFLKNKSVCTFTKAQPGWKAFINQRIRWASKSGVYPEWQTQLQLGVAYLFCLNIVVTFFLSFFLGWKMLTLFFILWGIKIIVDYNYLKQLTHFFDRLDLLQGFLRSSFLHLVYITVVGTLGIFWKQYEWKGRKVT